ncbi:MAG: hypothetical protein A2W91_02520 [Bacteroidetes bacterium GWF2_38_335]|nr:MAG: hypothetical protein A2W91_02520 [Bacteroidetes bacterium GWF2_38_335]OFY80721.1 MAG: hypothetical protein A2281_05535 [Bacteroidetes bacterium RIFOXYA12_FULL_38_20]HBS87068.1 hypothetical protein [Bacteroidales bacterium]
MVVIMGYRFGFQGQEAENEIAGQTGSHSFFKYRISDNRIGRFFAVDPLMAKYPWNSPYAFCENKVIQFIELEGLEATENRGNSEINMEVITYYPLPKESTKEEIEAFKNNPMNICNKPIEEPEGLQRKADGLPVMNVQHRKSVGGSSWFKPPNYYLVWDGGGTSNSDESMDTGLVPFEEDWTVYAYVKRSHRRKFEKQWEAEGRKERIVYLKEKITTSDGTFTKKDGQQVIYVKKREVQDLKPDDKIIEETQLRNLDNIQ